VAATRVDLADKLDPSVYLALVAIAALAGFIGGFAGFGARSCCCRP
jgi:hypothetical protein